MADAPKAQRRRRRRNAVAGISSAAPTADTSPSGVSTTTQPRPRRRVRRTRRVRLVNQPLVENDIIATRPRFRRRGLTRAIKRELKREGIDGPKVSVQQKITSTFGLIKPNTGGNVELELNFFLHPSLAKEANDGTAFGPVQALAAQYSLWRLKYLAVRFTPMVGASAVSGTVVRASLNLSQSPGGSNWSGLGTRVHVDMHPGQTSTFYLRADQLGGPRDGGWWFTDTNEEGSQSVGPLVEVHTMGKTVSTFKDEPWTGPLFLVEGTGMWQFANYNVKPALGSLERREGDTKVEIHANAAQPITMEMDSTSEVALFMDSAEPERYVSDVSPAAVPLNQSVGETIFQVVDVGANLAQNIAPPPFGWLIKGGWWFVKKLLGRTRAGRSEYVVYASLQDAQNNKPAIATATLPDTGDGIPTDLMVTQINSPNVGPTPAIAGTPRAGPQVLQPGETFRVASEMLTELFIMVPPTGSQTGQPAVAVPVSAIPGVLRTQTGDVVPLPTESTTRQTAAFIQTPWWIGAPGKAPGVLSMPNPTGTEYLPNDEKGGYIHSLYRLNNPKFTDQSGVFEFLEPTTSGSNVNFCVLNNFGGGQFTGSGTSSKWEPGDGQGEVKPGETDRFYAVYGKVVATSRIWSGTDPKLDMVLSLIKTTVALRFGNDNVRDMVLAFGDNANQVSFTLAPRLSSMQSGTWRIHERDIPVDSYLLGVSYTNNVGELNGVDIPLTLNLTNYSRIESTFAPIFPYYLSGQMLPATSIDIKMRYVEYHPPSRELIDQLRSLKVSFSLPPYVYEESGKPGPSAHGQGVEVMSVPPVPCILPPPEKEDDEQEDKPEHDCSCSGSDSDTDSVEQFMLDLCNECIELPKRWLNDPEFSRFLDM